MKVHLHVYGMLKFPLKVVLFIEQWTLNPINLRLNLLCSGLGMRASVRSLRQYRTPLSINLAVSGDCRLGRRPHFDSFRKVPNVPVFFSVVIWIDCVWTCLWTMDLWGRSLVRMLIGKRLIGFFCIVILEPFLYYINVNVYFGITGKRFWIMNCYFNLETIVFFDYDMLCFSMVLKKKEFVFIFSV